ncbi:ABC transporter permease [Thermoflavimicrobium daqui]|uniref:FtsX-like permease family protein n=1 Tax=Thermoflavimicrobium daqui TaxID=2137476 RepID=A0A364K5A6_9BACL|nr:ABC transporter permease [Thermoflavimicrobium daqui]RAL24560.1 hypothetical protein DL897_09645 [Thermoflavimicrobium daqui]
MRQLVWRFFYGYKKRTGFAILGVALAMIILVISQILLATLEQASELGIKQKYGNYDLMVGYQKTKQFLSESDIAKIKRIPQVKEIAPFYYPYIDENPIFFDGSPIPFIYIGVNNNPLAKEMDLIKRIKQGQLPRAGEVVLSLPYMKKKGLRIGDSVKIPFASQKKKRLTISGILHVTDVNIALFDLAWLQETTAKQGRITMMLVQLTDLKSKAAVIEQIRNQFPRIHIDKRDLIDKERENLGGLKPVVYGLNVTILIGSALLMITILQMSLHERKKELATIRLLGGKKNQLFRLVIHEAILVSTSGSLLGLGGGVGLSFLLQQSLMKWMALPIVPIVIPWTLILLSLMGGILFITLASLIPAYRSSQVPPMVAFRQAAPQSQKQKPVIKWVSLLCIISSVTLTIWNLMRTPSQTIYLVSGLLFTIGVFLAVSWILPLLVRGISWVFQLVQSSDRILSSRNTLRQLHRSTQLASVLMLAIIIGNVGLSILYLLKDEQEKQLSEIYPMEYILDANTSHSEAGFSEQIYDSIAKLPHMKAFPLYNRGHFSTQNLDIKKIKKEKLSLFPENGSYQTLVSLIGSDLETIYKQLPFRIISGQINSSALKQNGVVITKTFSELTGYKLGDPIALKEDTQLKWGDGPPKRITLKIVGIIDPYPFAPKDDLLLITHTDITKKIFGISTIDKIYFDVTKSSAKKEIEKQINQKLKDPSLSKAILTSRTEEFGKFIEQYKQRLWLLGAAVSLIALFSLLGLLNNTASSLQERRAEFAVLRALGGKRRQVLRLILWEGILVTTAGGFLGMIVSIFLGAHLIAALDKTLWDFPITGSLYCLAFSPIIGLIANFIPAFSTVNGKISRNLTTDAE